MGRDGIGRDGRRNNGTGKDGIRKDGRLGNRKNKLMNSEHIT